MLNQRNTYVNTQRDTWRAFHLCLEWLNLVVAEEQVHDGGSVGILFVDSRGQIALKTAGVEGQWVRNSFESSTWRHKASRSKVDRQILERTARDTSTACTGREGQWVEAGDGDGDVSLVWNTCAVARHGGVAAVEDRMVLGT